MINMPLKTKILRQIVKFEQRKQKRCLENLTVEQKFVYDIALKLLSLPNSVLESSPKTNVFYVKNKLKLLRFDNTSIHFVNGKYSYFFSYKDTLISALHEIFCRKKELMIKSMVDEISMETTSNLKKIYSELTETGSND